MRGSHIEIYKILIVTEKILIICSPWPESVEQEGLVSGERAEIKCLFIPPRLLNGVEFSAQERCGHELLRLFTG